VVLKQDRPRLNTLSLKLAVVTRLKASVTSMMVDFSKLQATAIDLEAS
jgi:hypothetical protein